MYQLTVSASTGGTISTPSGTVVSLSAGASTAIKAHANTGYAFSRWVVSGDNATVGYLNSASTTVKLAAGNDTVSAKFIAVPALPAQINIGDFQKEQGASFSYYKGTWTALPDFSALAPDSSGPCDSIDVASAAHMANNFGFVFNGYLSIPNDGEYTFYLKSSDGSALLINDSIIIRNDGIHASPVEDSAKVSLSQGDYLIAVRYFDANSTPFLNVSYAFTDFGIDKQTISNQSLQRPYSGPVAKIIVTNPKGGETFHIGDTVHVRWTYKNPRAQVFADISVDGGKSYELISPTAFPASVSSYDWKIPVGADSLISQQASIMIEEYPPFNVNGVSKTFSIAQ